MAGDGHDQHDNDKEPRGFGRRRLLQALGAAGGSAIAALAPAKWTKPLIEAVVLPAHAATSPGASPTNCSGV